MTLKVYSWGAYAAYDPKVTPYRDDDFRVNCMVRAVKGTLGAKQYADVPALNGQTYRITAGSESRAFFVFGMWGAHVLSRWTNALLVPVPSSSHTNFDVPFTGSKLAAAIANRMPRGSNVVAAPILAFKSKMPRASAGESGGRDRAVLIGGLQCNSETLRKQSVALIDDVCTSGAHLMTCADYLRSRGAVVETALCLARTVQSQHPAPLQLEPEDIEAPFTLFDR